MQTDSQNKFPVSKWTLAGLMACTSLATDIYLPAMEKELGGHAELTISGFLLGFAVAQLFWGPVSDRIGRRIPLVCGMSMFIIGSIGCARSGSMTMVIIYMMILIIFVFTGLSALNAWYQYKHNLRRV